MSSVCVFCAITAGVEPAEIVMSSPEVLIFRPLGPQVPGHVLVIPRYHVSDAAADPHITGMVATAAAKYAAHVGPCNIITSVGAEATQSVFHLHVHVLPRGAGDGLRPSWPWVRAKAES